MGQISMPRRERQERQQPEYTAILIRGLKDNISCPHNRYTTVSQFKSAAENDVLLYLNRLRDDLHFKITNKPDGTDYPIEWISGMCVCIEWLRDLKPYGEQSKDNTFFQYEED